MSIADQIQRLQRVKSDILLAIANKGATIPIGSSLADCPDLIASISEGGSSGEFGAENVVNIIPITKMVVVDSNGYIGFDLTNYFQARGSTFYYNYAILSDSDDFSEKGLGQVVFYTPASDNIGGRDYRTVVIGGKTWMAENLDFKFSGLAIGKSAASKTAPAAYYYNDDETTYGILGNKYGLLYNYIAVDYLSSLIPGWHVPTESEWRALATAVGGNPGTKLKSTSGWKENGNGTDDYGFSVFPAGSGYSSGNTNYLGEEAYFWTSTSKNSTYAYYSKFYYHLSRMDIYDIDKTMNYFSVRLVKDIQQA